jgi:hypothetical protein
MLGGTLISTMIGRKIRLATHRLGVSLTLVREASDQRSA